MERLPLITRVQKGMCLIIKPFAKAPGQSGLILTIVTIAGLVLNMGIALIVLTGFRFTGKDTSIQKTSNVHVAPPITIDPQDTYPVPTGNPKQLFYLQRTLNTNTIVCELNFDNKGQPDAESPVHVFWIRYNEEGQHKELNYIQRVFAYGIKSEADGNGNYKLHFVSYKKQSFVLMHSPKDNKYHIYATINQKQALLNRIFIKTDGGTFWSPNVIYMEMKGTDPVSGKELVERVKP